MLEIQKLEVGPLDACCYIVSAECSKAMIIDPGGDTERVLEYLEKKKLQPVFLVNTHGHGDHIGGNKELQEKFPNIEICIHADDAEMLEDPFKNLSLLGGKRYSSPAANRILNHNDKIVLDKYIFSVFHLPGHTRGGIGLYINFKGNGEVPILFSGDTLFAGGYGRTDLPGGSHNQLLESIKHCIFKLEDNTTIHPGHGPSTTVKAEKSRFSVSFNT